jgi:hypothetical protein
MKKRRMTKDEIEELRKSISIEHKKAFTFISVSFTILGAILGIVVNISSNQFDLKLFLMCLLAGTWIGGLLIFCANTKLHIFIRILLGLLYSFFLTISYPPTTSLTLVIFGIFILFSYFFENAIYLFFYVLSSG